MNFRDQASIVAQNNNLLVTGQLNFETVIKLWHESLPLLKQFDSWIFDFSGVISSNSAGLALLLEWLKYAKVCQKTIVFHHLPQQLLTIAKLADVDDFL